VSGRTWRGGASWTGSRRRRSATARTRPCCGAYAAPPAHTYTHAHIRAHIHAHEDHGRVLGRAAVPDIPRTHTTHSLSTRTHTGAVNWKHKPETVTIRPQVSAVLRRSPAPTRESSPHTRTCTHPPPPSLHTRKNQHNTRARIRTHVNHHTTHARPRTHPYKNQHRARAHAFALTCM
jgi:hypothetical protein